MTKCQDPPAKGSGAPTTRLTLFAFLVFDFLFILFFDLRPFYFWFSELGLVRFNRLQVWLRLWLDPRIFPFCQRPYPTFEYIQPLGYYCDIYRSQQMNREDKKLQIFNILDRIPNSEKCAASWYPCSPVASLLHAILGIAPPNLVLRVA